jgi:hypothetical protein
MVFFIPISRMVTGFAASELKPARVFKRIQQTLFATGFSPSFLFMLLAVLAFFVYRFGDRNQGLLLWLCGGLGFAGLNRNAFLTWWFLLFFLPFLKVFTEQVHLAYSLLPASIIIVSALEELWCFLQNRATALRYGFIFFMSLAAGDHLLNLNGSYRVVHSVNDGILEMSDWFRSNVPKGSIVVTNALHPEDIRLFSGGHITVFWTVQSGIPLPNRAVDSLTKLEALLRENKGKRNVYFLDVDYDFTRDKVRYHSHKYVRNQSVAMEKLGHIHTTQAYYPYLDPLKATVSRSYISFLGAPDLENDFYRGPAQNGTPFMRETYAEYHVYKVIGTSIRR